MGKGTLVGVISGFAAIFGSMIMEGGNPASLIAPPALLLIIVGTFGAACGGTSLEIALDAVKSIPKAFGNVDIDRVGVASRITSYAEQSRREGILSLEAILDKEPETLLRSGMRLLIDGSDHHTIQPTMIAMIQSDKKVWDHRADFFTKMGGYAPTLGIIGTVLGLIHTLESLGGDPSELGHLIAAAFIATFFGVTFANILFLPIGAKFKATGAQIQELGQLMVIGLQLLGSGSNPTMVRERLAAQLNSEEAEAFQASLKKAA